MSENQMQCDVLVVGSGAAALTAALRLAVAGKSVIVIEKTAKLGGTSAMSGAGIWIPDNPAMRAAGIEDNPEAALDYIRAVAPEGWQARWDAHWRALARDGGAMIAFVEAQSPLRFTMTEERDPYPDLPGARGKGRMISNQALSRWRLGRDAFRLRRSTLPEIFTYQEAVALDLFHRPVRTVLSRLPRLAWRWLSNAGGRGQALMIGLITACQQHGARILTQTPAQALITSQGRVCGVETGGPRTDRILAREAVVIASGGFEWDAALRAQYFPGPMGPNASAPGNSGDGQKMGAAIGAALANMTEATIHPSLPVRYENAIQGVPLPYHTEAGSLIVDASGRRFTNEQAFNIGVVQNVRDPATGLPLHAPAFLIADADYLPRLPIARWYLRTQPDWAVWADTPEALARVIGVPPQALAETLREFNEDCATGIDRHFGRRNDLSGPADRRKRSGISPIRRPPFIALPFNRSILSTKGGLLTDAGGRVLDRDDHVIPGLLAAGAAAASPIGTRAVGAGTTIGPYMTAGFICANTILSTSGSSPESKGISP